MPISSHQKASSNRTAQVFRLPLQDGGALGQAQPARARGGEALGGIDIALHLDERDRPLGQAAVRVEDRIVGVLPALVRQPRLGSARVLDEAVAIEITSLVDPRQRALDGRPQLADQRHSRRCAGRRGRRA